MKRSRTIAFGLVAFFVGAFAMACQGRSRLEPVAAPSEIPSEFADEPTTPSRPHVAEINFYSGLPEIDRAGLLGTPKKRSFADLIELLTRIEQGKESKIKGLFIIFGPQQGFARTQELARIVGRIRKGGMPVVCHAHDLGNETYWIAANACDRIWLSPAGSLETVGIAAQVLYAKRLLAELRIDVDMLQVGKFKGAVEPFTHDGPSDEARASLMQMLTSVRHQWLEGIEQARTGASPQMELGPYSPKEAKDKGLVDAVGMASEAREEAKTRANVSQAVVRFGPGAKTVDTSGIAELVRALSGAGGATDEPHVAVLRATGAIAATSSGALFSDGDGISERQLTQSLFQVGKDEAVRAVVLRIDSPGGSALASDLLWHQLMQLRKIKPLIVSIGDMAASGGYYLACAGTRVFAESSSIIGSIGVVGGKLAIGRGLDHLGVSAEVFPASDAQEARARAAYLSPFVAWDEASRVRALKTMQSVYELFVERVAEGRQLEPQRIAAFAEGRIFAAREGLELGMVDEIGGLQDAIAYALRVGGLEPTGAVRWVEQGSGLEKLLQLDPEDDVSAATGPMARNWVLRPILASTSSVEWLPYAEAWAPWIQGERMLVAVPFAILIR